MADLATLGLAIDSRSAVDAATALGNFREAAGGAQTAAQALQATVGRAGGSLAQATAGVREASSAHRDLAAQIGATATNLGNYVTRQGDATRAVNDTTTALARQAAGWRALGEAGRSAVQMYDRNAEAARRLGSLSSTGSAPTSSGAADALRAEINPAFRVDQQRLAQLDKIDKAEKAGAVSAQEAAQARVRAAAIHATAIAQIQEADEKAQKAISGRPGRLNANGLQNLFYQGTDIAASWGSGMPLTTIALQQGGQIAPTFMGPNGASISGVASQAGEALLGLAGRIGVAGGALGLLTVAVGTAAAAALSYRSAQDALKLQLAGTGRASGATIAGINADAALNAGAAGLSQREYREASGAFAATGRIGQEMYAGLIKSAKDFAYTTGQDVPEAIKDLAGAFADPAKGAQSLNERLGFLNDTTLENIQRLQAQGDRLGAQRVLMDSYSTSLLKVKDATSAWSQATTAAGNFVADIWDRIGAATNRSFTGGNSLEEQLATARRLLADARSFQGGIVDSLFGNATGEAQRLQSVVDAIQQMIAARDRANQQTATNRLSVEIGATVRGLNPNAERLKAVEDSAQKIRDNLTRLPLDEQGDARRAMDGLNAQARQLREDMKAGGADFADAVRNAQFSLRMVGASTTGRSLAEVEHAAEQRRLQLDRSNLNPGERLAQEYANEQVRQADLARVRAETTLQANQGGGALGRAPAAIQQQILTAVGQYPTVDPAILAGLLEKESGFRPTGQTRILGPDGRPASTAYGLGQITVGAERDIRGLPGMGGFDRTDPSSQVLGAAAYLSIRQQRAGGNLISALDGYGTGPGYGVDVLRRAGRLGDASDQAGALQLDTAKRAAEAAGQQLQNVTQNYGRNTVALEANQRATDQVNAAIAAGRQVTGDFTASIRAYETAAAQAARQTKIVQAGVDMAFDEAQLGRSAREQAGFARARSLLGETTSPEAQAIASRTIEYNDLRDAKSSLTDAATGFASDLRRGASAADAAANALTRISDKVVSGAIDSLISAAFKQGGGGGGMGGLLSSIFGGGSGGVDVGAQGWMPKFAGGGYTGAGGMFEPAGVVHRGEVVWSQADVARAGGPLVVDAMRLGRRGYADGGYVGSGAYPMPARPAANSNSGAIMPTINFVTPPGVALEADGPPQRRADGSYDQALRVVESGLANRARNGRGPLQQAAGGAWARLG